MFSENEENFYFLRKNDVVSPLENQHGEHGRRINFATYVRSTSAWLRN